MQTYGISCPELRVTFLPRDMMSVDVYWRLEQADVLIWSDQPHQRSAMTLNEHRILY